MATDDATYRYYYNGEFFHGNEKVQPPDAIYPNVWLHGTHRFVYLSATDNNTTSAQTLIRYDMDDNQSHSITKLPPGNHAIIGGSADGRWIYAFTQSHL